MSINKGCYSSGDRRTNWCEIERFLPQAKAAEVKKLAKSVACLISNDALDPNTHVLKDNVDSFHQYMMKNQAKINSTWIGPKNECKGLSEQERFREEPACGFGTAFLVGDQLALTAAHCILEKTCSSIQPDIKSCSLIFDFHMTCCKESCLGSNKNEWNHSGSKETYSFTVLAYKYTRTNEIEEDWAILKLDRKVEGRAPLKINFGYEVAMGRKALPADNVFMMGHPFGLPLKFTRNAVVIEQNSASTYFTANLDAFRGNSGSPVFHSETLEVVGMLYKGDMEDFICKEGTLYTHHASADDEKQFKEGEWKHERCYKATGLHFLQATLSSIDLPDISKHFWGAMKQGLNVEATCTNQECTENGKTNFFPLNKRGKFNVRDVCAHTDCPQCKQPIKYKDINMIVLTHCVYMIEGMNSEGKYVKEKLLLEEGRQYNLDIRKWKFIELDINY